MDFLSKQGVERLWQHTINKLGERVPTSRLVNGKELSEDITLTAEDVGAVSKDVTINGKPLEGNVIIDSTGEVINPLEGLTATI